MRYRGWGPQQAAPSEAPLGGRDFQPERTRPSQLGRCRNYACMTAHRGVCRRIGLLVYPDVIALADGLHRSYGSSAATTIQRPPQAVFADIGCQMDLESTDVTDAAGQSDRTMAIVPHASVGCSARLSRQQRQAHQYRKHGNTYQSSPLLSGCLSIRILSLILL